MPFSSPTTDQSTGGIRQPAEAAPLFRVSLCSSRACLGKWIVLCNENGSKTALPAPGQGVHSDAIIRGISAGGHGKPDSSCLGVSGIGWI